MRRFLAIATVLFSLSAFAERIDIQPPNPESTTQITVLITGSNHCVPNAPAVNVTGTEIGLSLMFDSQCASQANPFAIPVRLPLLQPATYTLTLLSGNPPAPPAMITTTFSVAEASPRFAISPSAASVLGGDLVTITSTNSAPIAPCLFSQTCTAPAVTFGGVPATAVNVVSLTQVTARVPAHAAGAVTVGVGNLTAVNVFRYFDRDAAPDPAVFETVLIPLLFEGPGAFGSRWSTEVFVTNKNDSSVISYRPLFFVGCNFIFGFCADEIRAGKTVQILPVSSLPSNGVLFRPLRDQANALWYAARVRDLSREADDFGAEMPIVRESKLYRGKIVLPDVLIDPNFRTLLRIYMIEDVHPVAVDITQLGTSLGGGVVFLTKGNADTAWSGSLDLSALPVRGLTRRFTVVIDPGTPSGRLWAFASVTNNVTQRVTIISPQ